MFLPRNVCAVTPVAAPCSRPVRPAGARPMGAKAQERDLDATSRMIRPSMRVKCAVEVEEASGMHVSGTKRGILPDAAGSSSKVAGLLGIARADWREPCSVKREGGRQGPCRADTAFAMRAAV